MYSYCTVAAPSFSSCASTLTTRTVLVRCSVLRSYCPFYKTVGMMKNLMQFYELATQAVDSTSQLEPERRILWSTIRDHFGGDGGLIHKLTSMKFKALTSLQLTPLHSLSHCAFPVTGLPFPHLQASLSLLLHCRTRSKTARPKSSANTTSSSTKCRARSETCRTENSTRARAFSCSIHEHY